MELFDDVPSGQRWCAGIGGEHPHQIRPDTDLFVLTIEEYIHPVPAGSTSAADHDALLAQPGT
jgi:hypothetical protein